MTDLHYGLTVRPKRLREALGPLAACGQRSETIRTTHLLAQVTCEHCRNMVESAGVAMWEIDAQEIEASYRREVRVLRWKLALRLSTLALVTIAVVAALVWLTVVIWQGAGT